MSISLHHFPDRNFLPTAKFVTIILSSLVLSHLLSNYLGLDRIWYISISLFLMVSCMAIFNKVFAIVGLTLKQIHPYIILLTSWAAYFLYAAQFDAVPADFIFHLNNMKYALIELDHWNEFKFVGSWYSSKGNHYGYMPFALQAWLMDLKPYELYAFWAWFNPLILLFAVYEFANFLFQRITSSEQQARFLAVFASLSLPFLLGVDAFSYVRAYSSAAALWGFILFLFASYLVIRFYDELQYGIKKVWVYAALFLVTVFVQFLMHPQEAVFSLIMAVAMTGVLFMRCVVERNRSRRTLIRGFWPAMLFSTFVVFVLSGLLAARLLPLSGQPPQHLMSLAFGDIEFYIVNIEAQLHRVLGFQGSLILLTVLITWPLWMKHSYFLAILIVPFITVMNPLFVHAMTSESSSGILYRFFFLLQPYLFFALFLYMVFVWLSRRLPEVRSSLRAGVVAIFGVVFLVGAKPDKLPTLLPLDVSESSRHWADLWEFMDSLDEFKTVYSDPVTGYMVNGFTRQHFEGYKFIGGNRYVPMQAEQFSGDHYPPRRGSYLIVNRRDGGDGHFTSSAGHWPSDVLLLSQHYSPEFLSFLEQNPEQFKPVWKSADSLIVVYSIV